MNKIYTVALLFVAASHSVSFTQTSFIKEKRDYVWLLGYDSNLSDLSFGGTRIDFNYSPPLLSYEYRNLDFDATNASICDSIGNLLFYTNGIFIHAPTIPQGQQIVNGGGLNPDPYTQEWASRGYNLIQGALILSVPDSVDKYYLLHGEKTTFPEGIFGNYRIVAKLYQTNIERHIPGWIVTAKNQILINDILDFGKITATRHANASDTYREWVEVTVTATKEVTSGGMAMKLYPNPAKDYVVIEPQQRLPPGAFWSLRDALGRELRRVPLPEGQPQLVLNLEGLPGGVYFCSIEDAGKVVWRGKVIKQ